MNLKAPQLSNSPQKYPNKIKTTRKNTNQKTQYESLKNLPKMQTPIKHKLSPPYFFLFQLLILLVYLQYFFNNLQYYYLLSKSENTDTSKYQYSKEEESSSKECKTIFSPAHTPNSPTRPSGCKCCTVQPEGILKGAKLF